MNFIRIFIYLLFVLDTSHMASTPNFNIETFRFDRSLQTDLSDFKLKYEAQGYKEDHDFKS